MNQKIYLQTNTDLNATKEIISWLEQINKPPFSNPQTWWEVQTLLVEGFINIVEHAHKNLPKTTPIEIEVMRLTEVVEIRMWSFGQSFNLVDKLQTGLDLDENFQERGRGLKIMFLIADQLSYQPTKDNRYCLFMSKQY